MRDRVSGKTSALIPVGIVGAGRTRAGLGPFLAQFLEHEGFLVRGVSGRSVARATANAEAIWRILGHEVQPFASPAALSENVDALVIASPAEFHLEALHAAGEAGLPVLCEKPLIHENHGEQGAEIIEVFSRKRLPLVENCQWPYVLPAFFQLHGALTSDYHLKVEMGLGQLRSGRELVQNTVSHLLSVVQGVFDSNAVVSDVTVADPSYKEDYNELRFRLVGPEKSLEGVLHLRICTTAPRPAWLAINGCRIDRQVRQGYSLAFTANGKEAVIGDPTRDVVQHFASLVRSRDSVLMNCEHDRIRQRLEWYRQIMNKLE
jgi:predicted dehydrogenase